MSQVTVELQIASLPPGWEGTPRQFLDWIKENTTFQATGVFLTGQIGGSRPTVDSGLFVNGKVIEVWDGARYVPATTMPVGVVFEWPSDAAVPADYLLCQGQTVAIVDYPELYAVLGLTHSNPAGETAGQFRLPDYRGRASVGAGYGEYRDADFTTIGGITPRVVGEQFGKEWVERGISTYIYAPTPRYNPQMAGTGPEYIFNGSTFVSVVGPRIAVHKIIRAK